MYISGKTEKKSVTIKLTAMAFCLIFLFSVSLALILPIVEGHHDCTGEHCHICKKIEQWEVLTGGMGDSLPGLALFLLSTVTQNIDKITNRQVWRVSTPVSQKVKLLN